MSNNENKTAEKKRLSPKARQIIDITVTAIQVVIVIFCIILSIIIWTGASGDPINRSVNWFAIRSDSMSENSNLDYASLGYDKKLCFNPGDMVIVKKVAFEDIEVGDVIAYKASVMDGNGNISEQVVTHRVIAINNELNAFTTAGDKDTAREDTTIDIPYSGIYGKMTGKLKGVGGMVLWLQGYKKVTMADGSLAYDYSGSSATFLVIIIPLALLFLYNGFYVVKWAMDEKVKKAKESAKREVAQQAAEKAVNDEAIKREALRAILLTNGLTEEQIQAYFAKQDEKKNAELAKDSEVAEEAEASDVEE